MSIDERIGEIYDSVLSRHGVAECIEKLRSYDEYTYEHSIRVCLVAIRLGVDYFFSDQELITLGVASLLHDYGKIRIPLKILNKKGKLTDAEYECMKLHPLYGALELQKLGFESEILRIVVEHHEGLSGKGYPLGKTYSELSLMSRLVLVADIYDALTSNRGYRTSHFSPDEAVSLLLSDAKADRKITELLDTYVKKVQNEE